MTQNPFFVGGAVPPEYFVGRTSEVNTAFDQFSSRSHLAVYGSPGMGKSSLLQFLAAPLSWQAHGYSASAAFIVYLNCTDINPFTPSAFWREVLRLLKDKSEDDVALVADITEALGQPVVEKSDLRRMLRKIGQRNKFLVLLLDDYDAALRPNDKYTETETLTFLSEFRNLAVNSEEGRYLTSVVTTFRRLNELGPKLTPAGSPWYNHYLFWPLKSFSDPEASFLLNKMPSVWALGSAQQEGIRELADGHPALLQNACYLLHNIYRDGQAPDAAAFAAKFASATEQFFRDAWDFSTETEQMLLMLIALSHLEGRLNQKRRYDLVNIDLIFSQRDRELRDLEERGIIRSTVEHGKNTYSFISSIMEWWVIKEIENCTDEKELQQREQVFLTLSRKQAEQIKQVVQQVWQYKDAMTSVAGWAGKLVGAFVKGAAGGGT